jgi:uncharacterized membrane protein YfcA
MSTHTILLTALVVFFLIFAAVWIAAIVDARRNPRPNDLSGVVAWPTWAQIGVGFVTNFFDTLGIGSFAPTTSFFKLRRMVPDRLIPGTLNVGHTPPTIAEALIFIAIVAVDTKTLVLLIGAAVLGAWLGAGIVGRWPRRKVQIGMGAALLAAAALMLMTQFNWFPAGGNTIGLSGVKLGAGAAGSFVLGALMTLGIGLYAPCMIMISLLGMNPLTAFPIMMGSCAFLMPIGSSRFVRLRAYSQRPAFGLTLGGVPGVLIAAFLVRSLPLSAIRWLVVFVVVYTAAAMLRSAFAGRADEEDVAVTPDPVPADPAV